MRQKLTRSDYTEAKTELLMSKMLSTTILSLLIDPRNLSPRRPRKKVYPSRRPLPHRQSHSRRVVCPDTRSLRRRLLPTVTALSQRTDNRPIPPLSTPSSHHPDLVPKLEGDSLSTPTRPVPRPEPTTSSRVYPGREDVSLSDSR